MSKSDGTVSEPVRVEAGPASVFDFLFYDARRVGSFLSQITENGPLQAFKTTENASNSSAGGTSSSGEVGFPGIGKVSEGSSASVGQIGAEGTEKTYDPYWVNALIMLDVFRESGSIQKKLESGNIGQIVQASGRLDVLDLSLFQSMWDMPYMRDLIVQAANLDRQPLRSQGKSPIRKDRHTADNPADVIFDLIKRMPHVVQAKLQTPGHAKVWCSLANDGLVMEPAALLLKYGVSLAGTWHIIGILDAVPISPGQLVSSIDGSPMMAELFAQIANPARTLLGRPDDFFGITPLLIFREIVNPKVSP